MKPEHLSPTLLVLAYCLLVVAGTYNLIFGDFGLIGALSVATNAVILMVLLLVGGQRLLAAGVLFCWWKMALSVVLILFGVWATFTANPLYGLFLIAIGSVAGIGLAWWTLKVLYAIERQLQAQEA